MEGWRQGDVQGLRGSSHLGDVIVELDGALIKDSSDLYRTLDKLSVGQEIMMKVMRGENKVDLPLTLDDLKDQPQCPRPASTKSYRVSSFTNPASRGASAWLSARFLAGA